MTQTAEQRQEKLPYPPPWQDISTLCAHICASESTIDRWVKLGRLPAPRLVEGKRLWKWKEVERYLEEGGKDMAPSADSKADEVRNATRRAIAHARQ